MCDAGVLHLYYMKDSHLTLRLSAELARALARKARSLGLPKSQVAREAVERYVAGRVSEVARPPRLTAAELAAQWETLPRLSADEANQFAADIAAGREAMPAIRTAWD